MTSRFRDPDRRGYFVENCVMRMFWIRSGVRYVDPIKGDNYDDKTTGIAGSTIDLQKICNFDSASKYGLC